MVSSLRRGSHHHSSVLWKVVMGVVSIVPHRAKHCGVLGKVVLPQCKVGVRILFPFFILYMY